MKELLEKADQFPATLVTALAYVTMAFLTDPFHPTTEVLHAYGALRPIDASEGEPWRLLSAAFLHGGILHLGFNTYFLVQIGPMLERSLGSVRWVILYVVAALGGSLAVCLVNDPTQMVVGGSGALFGMLGAAVAMQMRSGRHTFAFLDFEGPRQLLGLIAINLVIGFLIPFISNTAHIGGLCAGFLVTFLFLVPPRQPQAGLGAWRAVTALLFATFTLHALRPVTRWDWLWDRGVASTSPSQKAEAQRLAAMSYFGRTNAGARDVRELVDKVFEPDGEQPGGDEQPRRPR
ncbi:MAG: rhomboid family intramembrane serine protease [Planctomycetes bacterium]|nr:rhomboid family intramembrane serine protease [Planctomycetota bacterium]